MRDILERIRNIESECCVTIILKTHRNRPDFQKDVIMLKNLVSEAEQRLYSNFDKRVAASVTAKLKQLAESVDHGNSLDGLILFANQEIAEMVKIAIEVEDRVIVDNSFATRDLLRAVQMQEAYYILVLSRDKVRLLEAMNDQLVREFDAPFPIINTDLHPNTAREQSKARQMDFLVEEFFNRVDKTLWPAINEKPLPVLICSEERTFYHYMNITDHKEKIIGHLSKNILEEKAGNIVLEAWPIVLNMLVQKNEQRITELHKALNDGRIISDTNEVWRALNEGRGQTLFVRQGYFQPAKVSQNLVEVIDGQENFEHEDRVDDIIEKMIDVSLRNGGDVVFLPEEKLNEFNGLALVARF